MSRIRNTLVALTATVGLGLTMTATATPAQAAPACSSNTVSCSKYWAARTNGSVAYYLKTSEHVKNLQRSLKALGYDIAVDGFYGYQTKTKLRVYQGSRRLQVNGVLDARTLAALRSGMPKAASRSTTSRSASRPSAISTTACTSNTVSCSKYWAARTNGSVAYYLKTSEHVKNLQRSLRALGYDVPATGYYGYQTKTNLRVYQRSRRLQVNGVLDARTLAALRSGSAAGSSTSRAAKAVSFASKQLGKPYIYGATGPRGYDCSGLTSSAWRAAGKSIPRTSYAQLGGLKRVSKSNLRPGDIVGFYSGGHVGIYIGGGQVIQASRPGRPIAKAKVSSMPFYTAVRPA